jgi:hypothetical protein
VTLQTTIMQALAQFPDAKQAVLMALSRNAPLKMG